MIEVNSPWTMPVLIPFSLTPSKHMLPFFEGSVRAGQSRFVSAAQDYEMKELDLNELLIKDPPAPFMVKVAKDCDSMVDVGIFPDSKLIINRALGPKAKSSNIVVAIVNGEFVVKRLYKRFKIVRLLSENRDEAYPPIEFKDGEELMSWGVVSHLLQQLIKELMRE